MGDTLVILAELAGLRRENLSLTVDGSRLLISGVRPEQFHSNHQHLVSEIHVGPFECVIDIPGDYDPRGKETRATYQNGFLRIRIQRRESSDPTLHASAALEPNTEGQVVPLVVSNN